MKRFNILAITLLLLFTLSLSSQSQREVITGTAGSTIIAEDFGFFSEPWAMTFLPDGRLLVTEKAGRLYLYDWKTKTKKSVSGLPEVAYGGQGGLGDIILHPDFERNHYIYFSYAEDDGTGNFGAAVARAHLIESDNKAELRDREIIWRQYPKVPGMGHYSHRLVFDREGYLFIASGDRQKLAPAQDWDQALGKVIRLHDDGSLPKDNPFQENGELAKSFWTLGHRNILGMAIDGEGKLWAHEMGPRHGDEWNLIERGENYGWPLVSWGNHYSGADIPDHDTNREFRSPETYWIPSIAPSGLILYEGEIFQDWQGDALIGGLVSTSLVRVENDGENSWEAERFNMGKRIREVEEGPLGEIWILEDRKGARLRRLTPQ